MFSLIFFLAYLSLMLTQRLTGKMVYIRISIYFMTLNGDILKTVILFVFFFLDREQLSL